MRCPYPPCPRTDIGHDGDEAFLTEPNPTFCVYTLIQCLFCMCLAFPGVRQSFTGERPAGFWTEDEPAKHESANCKNGVNDHPQPYEVVNDPPRHEFSRTCIPHTVFHACPCLHQTNREQTEQYHQRQSDIDGPERESESLCFPHVLFGQSP